MKNPVESSVISRSQSDINSEKGKSQLLHATTTKLDSLFPFFDQICTKAQLPMILYYLSTIYLYFQIFFTSLYPFNKIWHEINEDRSLFLANFKIIKTTTILEQIAWFLHIDDASLDGNSGRTSGETNLLIPTILLFVYFTISVFFILIELFSSSKSHKSKKFSLYAIRFMLDIVSPVLIVPSSAIIGVSIRNLVLSEDKLNWIFLIIGIIMHIVFILYAYASFIIQNQSTCISMTFLSSFNIKIPLLLPTVTSFYILLQCIFSLFDYWAMLIVQLSHIVVSLWAFYPMIYLIFHSQVANALFMGVTFSTWLNDVTFFILHFIPPPSKNNGNTVHEKIYFYYMSSLIIPVFSLVVSMVLSTLFVRHQKKLILNELIQLNEPDESTTTATTELPSNNNNENFLLNAKSILFQSRLFRNEKLALMSIHLSFLNGLSLFYKWTAINYVASQLPTTMILINCVQYMSFIPGTSRKLNSFLRLVSQKRDLKYHQRFLLYQVYRVKMMRQSSVSTEANYKLSELKNSSTGNYEDVYSFYGAKNCTSAYFEMISDENYKIDSKWEDAIREFPNFQKLCDEYCSYLIECEMNLPRALVMKHRSSLIEMGRNFIVDHPFVSLAKSVPLYLKRGIVDYQGSIKNHSKILPHSNNNSSNNNNNNNQSSAVTQPNSANNGSTGTSGSTGMFSSSSSMLSYNYNLDPEFEESLGRQLFRQTALRLEMHRSLANRKSYASLLLLIYAYFILIGGIALIAGIYIYIDDYIVERSDSMFYLNLAAKIRFYLDLSILGTTLKYAYYTKRFTTLDKFNELDLKDDIDEKEYESIYNQTSYSGYDADMFDINDEISFNLIHRNIIISKDSFNQLIVNLATLSFFGESVYELAHIMMASEVPFTMCHDGVPGMSVLLSLKTLEAYVQIMVDHMASVTVKEGTWFSSDEICEILANQPTIETFTLQLFTTLMEHEIKLCEKEDKFIIVFANSFPLVPLLLYFIPPLIFTRLFIKDANKLAKILLGTSSEAKEEARKPIQRDSSYEVSQATEKKPKSKKWLIMKIALFVFSLLTTLFIYFMIEETKELNGNVKKLGRWNLLSSIRMSSSVESMNYMLSAVILNGSSSLNITNAPNAVATRKRMISLCRSSLVELENSNEALIKGNAQVPSCNGFDHKLDEINFHVACEVVNNETELHDSYRCSSGSQGISIFKSMIEAVLDDIEQTKGNFDHDMIYHSLHLLNRHLLGRLEQAFDRIHEININHCNALESKSTILLVCGIFTTIIIFIILLLFYNKSVRIYEVGMILAQRFPPAAFLSDKRLLNFILNRKERKEETEMSTAQSVIYMSLDAVICTNDSGVIEIINPSVTNILGYTPDQMLGQHISTFFVDFENKDKDNNNNNDNTLSGDSGKITNQIELMKNGQSGLVFEGHFTCLTDDDKEMPCGLTILGMTDNKKADEDDIHFGSVNVESFVFILRDETELMQQQKEAEKAKARSENLLFQILPRDIVARLNSGEKDISFTVQSASIIFTDIVKFSEYASGLSPQEIMGSLSTLFAAFDNCAKAYKLITKIKLISDIYMAAAGLFSDDINPKDHAEEILKFGLDCLLELDEINLKLNANLQLRVGVNSGGPVLAGVLGTDKPVFDIIGDPINVAARLQTTDVPGKVQIPKNTYDLVCDGNFCIEERGEVFLKGKGKTMAYLVTPFQPNNNAGFEAVSSTQKFDFQ